MTIEVLSPGPLTTVQDLGRSGWRHLGVALAGALDPLAASVANRLVGNPDNAAVLECTLHGPVLRLRRPMQIALCGAEAQAGFVPEADTASTTRPVHFGRPVTLPAGTLRLGGFSGGIRAWLAFAGGLSVPRVLGSRSTDLKSGFGGLDGRPLRRGDVLQVASHAALTSKAVPQAPAWWVAPDGRQSPEAPIRYVRATGWAGPHICSQRWTVGSDSNRQGLRLEGKPLSADRGNMVSSPVAPGTIQLPPEGKPIVLLADAQTVGGYPRMGHVAAVDLRRLAQAAPGTALTFESMDAETAAGLWRGQRALLARVQLMLDARS